MTTLILQLPPNCKNSTADMPVSYCFWSVLQAFLSSLINNRIIYFAYFIMTRWGVESILSSFVLAQHLGSRAFRTLLGNSCHEHAVGICAFCADKVWSTAFMLPSWKSTYCKPVVSVRKKWSFSHWWEKNGRGTAAWPYVAHITFGRLVLFAAGQ